MCQEHYFSHLMIKHVFRFPLVSFDLVKIKDFICALEEFRLKIDVPWFYRPSQLLVLESLVRGHHCFVVQPTGSGKSEIFLALPHVLKKVRNF